jgi:hypothetical protein
MRRAFLLVSRPIFRYHDWIQNPPSDRPRTVKPPRIAALLLALIPFVTMCLTVAAWDRIDPMVLGMPFNLFWLTAWIALTPLCMWGAYRIEMQGGRKKDDPNA